MNDQRPTQRAIAPRLSNSLIPEVLPVRHDEETHVTHLNGATYRIVRVDPYGQGLKGNWGWFVILAILILIFGTIAFSLILAIALKPTPTNVNPICILNCNAMKETNFYASRTR